MAICTPWVTQYKNKIVLKITKKLIVNEILENTQKIFIYGQKINDFNFLDKTAIFTVATAALQEVDRQLQEERQKVKALEDFIKLKFPGEF